MKEVDRPLLHAYEIEFEHPFTGQTVLVQAPVPEDMTRPIRRTTMRRSESPTKAKAAVECDEESISLIGSDGRLQIDTEVPGYTFGPSVEDKKGYVPSDRLLLSRGDDDWTEYGDRLLEEPSDFHVTLTRKGQRGKW